ncbi:unnamed protein product [Allacma fusca]|uniref:Uncharacterized protein n=1 Tax=Allacma fusca TaxID=39272 RepID=A0A8J2PUW4_9HEXA|nr:unnamed protein product [Allacma fusca]
MRNKNLQKQQGHQVLQQEWKRCREVQLTLRIFNESNCYLQCVQNLWYFYESILLGYFGIRIMLDDIVLGLSFLGLGVLSATFFILMYRRAFVIPVKIEEHKTRIKELVILCGTDNATVDILVRNVDSVKSIGIQVGHYMTMHRLSAVMFVDFVSQNILSLLLAY